MPVQSVFRPNLGDLFDVTSSAAFGADASPLLAAPRTGTTPARSAFPFLPSPMGRARDVVMESGASSLLSALSPTANAPPAPEFTFATPKQAPKSVGDENAGVNADADAAAEPACDTPPLIRRLGTPKVVSQPAVVASTPPPAPPAPASPAAPVVESRAEATCVVETAAPAPASEAKPVEEAQLAGNAATPVPPKTATRRRGATPGTRGRKAGNSGDDSDEVDAAAAAAPAPLVTPARVTRSSARAAAATAAVTPAAPAAALAAVPAKTPKTGGRRPAGKAQRVAVQSAADVPDADPPAAVAERVATASEFKDPYSAEALAQLMANPSAAFARGPKAVQNSPVKAPAAGRTPRAARKKTAEERHAECWTESPQ